MGVESKTSVTDERDEFVSDPVVARELGISLVTIWRHDSNREMSAWAGPRKSRSATSAPENNWRASRRRC
jgi:hypothetical protein